MEIAIISDDLMEMPVCRGDRLSSLRVSDEVMVRRVPHFVVETWTRRRPCGVLSRPR